MFELTGRKALVTGASGGIGESIARYAARPGRVVGLHGTRARSSRRWPVISATEYMSFPPT
jgi:NAD(P)-dependent dehydrogenase (short-subunit alcohol dehydrogenase family)